MKPHLLTLMLKPVLVAILGVTLFPGYVASAAAETLFRNATVITSDGNMLRGSDVLVRDGRIAQVAADIEAPTAKVFDLAGRYLLPGLIDAHMHFGQSGLFDLRPDYFDLRERYPYAESLAYQRRHVQRYLNAYRAAGVTTVYDTGGMPWTIDLQWRTDAGDSAPRVYATGTLLTPAPAEMIATVNTPFESVMRSLSSAEAGRAVVDHNVAMGSTGIKMWGFAQNDPVMDERTRAVAAYIGNKGSFMLAHATTLEQAKYAMRLGAKVLVHSVDDQLIDEAFIALAKENDVVYIPTLHVYRAIHELQKAAFAGKFTDRKVLDALDEHTRERLLDFPKIRKQAAENLQADQAIAAAALKKAEAIRAKNLRIAVANGITVAVGTDAGNPGMFHGLSYINELRAMHAAGVPLTTLIGMATAGGAAALQRSADFGDVRAGLRADFTILDRNPLSDLENFSSVYAVVRDGRMQRIDN